MQVGERVGGYVVVGPIGSGGMGEVYRARDAKLGRDVALKVLPDDVAGNPDRLARFEREARLLAVLNHPNIGAIYGLEGASGSPALVLELVEGETLQDLLEDRRRAGRPLTIEEALSIARQIADALDAAHEKGIVHRDLKPANVKVTPQGVVKLLDFGLGRLTLETATESLTLSMAADTGTQPGAVLGTAPYMCPEQARGASVDKRADIWAFGCVLFEMVAGSRAFDGGTFSDAIAQVIANDPDWGRLPVRTPPALLRLLKRCLEKDPRRRLRDIGDARRELDDVDAADDGAGRRAAIPGRSRDVRLERLTDLVNLIGSPAVSPDGKMLAFVAVAGARRQIWIRFMAGGAPHQVTRDDVDHDAPRWLPDSSTLLYHSSGTEETGDLWQVSALGGPPRRVATSVAGGDVSHDGRRVALFNTMGTEMALVIAALDGSAAQTLLRLSPEFVYGSPRWSPDDRLISFERWGKPWVSSLEVVPAEGDKAWTLAHTEWLRGHAWLPDGSAIVYSSSRGSTLAYPPTNSLRIITLDGSDDRQLTFGDISYTEPDIDASGRLLARRTRYRSDVWSFPIDGTPEENTRAGVPLTCQTGQIQVPSLSPDGREIVYISDNGGHSNLWVARVDGSSVRQITFENDPGVTVAVPNWSPAGDRLAFVRAHRDQVDVCLVHADGSRFRTLLEYAFGPCWSRDGRSLYSARVPSGVDKMDVETGAVTRLRSEAASAEVSSDGSTLYFTRLTSHLGYGYINEVCRATPPDGPAEILARLASSRVPLAPRLWALGSLSPDARWLALPLLDGATSNIWLIPTDGRPMRVVTHFAARPVFIARWVSWSQDSRRVIAAVADMDADVVALHGILD